MFRRDDTEDRYSVAGLWGSGNTVARRDELFGGTPTVYTMWDGHALFGPDRPDTLERFPLFLARLTGAEFEARYGALDACEVWVGEEAVGVGCVAACEGLAAACDTVDLQTCMSECAPLPRALVDCLAAAPSCEWETTCGLAR